MAKSFSWSFSKLKNFKTCAKRHYEVDIQKNFQDGSEQLVWGNEVHDALAKACAGKSSLPATMKDYQKWVDLVQQGGGELRVEQKYAITADFQPTEFFSPRAWYRGIADVVRVDGPVALAIDWKTGQIKHDSIQLMLMASCIFAFYPRVQRVKTEFIWLKDDCHTDDTFDRATIRDEWIGVLEDVHQYETAVKTLSFPPNPGPLCRRHCPVLSCPFHGKGSRG